jgi:hypothetical protein
MFDTLDVSKAQATVEADRKRILAEIDVSDCDPGVLGS